MSKPTFFDREDVCLFIRIKISESCHRPKIRGTEKVGRYILKSKCVILLPQK